MERNKPFSEYCNPVPLPKKSSLEFAKLFLQSSNTDFKGGNLKLIIDKCCTLKKLHLSGCVSVNDKLFQNLCPIQTVQENLRSLNIYGTSVSPKMAVSVFYCLPKLEKFVYHDLTGFLQFADISKHIGYSLENRTCNLQLGKVHDAAIHLTYSNCDDLNPNNIKVLELFLPAKSFQDRELDMFNFSHDDNGLYNFKDIYNVIVAVQPAQVLGNFPDAYHLTEMSFFSVKDIDLDLMFSSLKCLRKMLLHSCFTRVSYLLEVSPHIVSPNTDSHLSKSLMSLYLCNMISNDVVRIIRHCPNLKELNLYDVEITNSMFNYLTSTTKLTMENCYGCPGMQFLYGFHVPRLLTGLRQRLTFKERFSLCEFLIFVIIGFCFCYAFLLFLNFYR